MRMKTLLLTAAALLGLPAAAQAAPQSKTYVISWFTQVQYSEDGDCPKGFNPLIGEVYRRDLLAVGYSPGETEKIVIGMSSNDPYAVNAIVNRGRIDGKPVNAYTHPVAVSGSPQIVTEGKHAYGFNLDGKSAA